MKESNQLRSRECAEGWSEVKRRILHLLAGLVVGAFGGLTFALSAFAAEPWEPRPYHECHALWDTELPDWTMKGTVLDFALHNQRAFLLVLTEHGCKCLMMVDKSVQQVPNKDTPVVLHGYRLGLPKSEMQVWLVLTSWGETA